MSERTPHTDATDELDAVLTGIRIVLDKPDAAVDRATLERWSRQAGRALLYLTEHAPPDALGPIPHQPFVRKGRDLVTAPETLSSTVFDLKPGARVLMPDGRAATFVQHAPHPLTPNLRLVIWKMPDGSWSHDALDLFQHVGEALAATDDERRQALREALLHRSQW